MDKKEKILLIELLLRDIRGNWGYENGSTPRYVYALELADDVGLDKHSKRINNYNGNADGRYFRCHYDQGGYEDMEDLHGLEYTIMDKSEEFKEKAIQFLTHPETAVFDDWGDYRVSQGWERY